MTVEGLIEKHYLSSEKLIKTYPERFEELMTKHPDISYIELHPAGYIEVSVHFEIYAYALASDELRMFSFKDMDECDIFLTENYLRLKFEMMEKAYMKFRYEIKWKTEELNELHKKLNKSREE